MTRSSRAAAFAALSILWCSASASAETMRCQSVNGNLNCAGSGGVSCQIVNGQKTCVSGHGDVVQSFGKSTGSDLSDDGADADGPDDVPPGPVIKEQHGPRSHTLLMDRDGAKLHLRTDRLSIDRD